MSDDFACSSRGAWGDAALAVASSSGLCADLREV